ncbi:DUF2795 domain-containing protein [Micromonospora sp. NPDC005686]|uniref:DUF2795 domain-containing protein n=1 Tax=unclassified Micromonospora TaxID=2617518 RepID=UPI0033ADF7FA
MPVTGAQLREFLAGLDYPVSREDLIRWARRTFSALPGVGVRVSMQSQVLQCRR